MTAQLPASNVQRESIMIVDCNEEQIKYDLHQYAVTSLQSDFCIGIAKSKCRFVWDYLNDQPGDYRSYIKAVNLLVPSLYFQGLDWESFLWNWYHDLGNNYFEVEIWGKGNNQIDCSVYAIPEEVPDNWVEELVKIYQKGITNQGIISELKFKGRTQPLIEYNEMKFATHTEMNCAIALERLEILFSPLPLFVKGFGQGFQGIFKKEPDFLIFDENGNMGILEIQNHLGGEEKWENDRKKAEWFMENGIKFHHTMPSSDFNSIDKAAEAVTRFMELMEKNFLR